MSSMQICYGLQAFQIYIYIPALPALQECSIVHNLYIMMAHTNFSLFSKKSLCTIIFAIKAGHIEFLEADSLY